MEICLGNLSIQEMADRLGVVFHKELVEFLEARHQDRAANIAPGKWHCFDIPFTVVCGDMETATALRDLLVPLSSQFQARLVIALESK